MKLEVSGASLKVTAAQCIIVMPCNVDMIPVAQL